MKRGSTDGDHSPIPRPDVVDSARGAWAAALATASMVLFVPAVSADELICEVPRDGVQDRYLIDIDDRRGTVAVVDADTTKPIPVTVGELTPGRVSFAFNGMRLDPTKFVRDGKVVTMSVTINQDALLDRSANSLTEIGYVTDEQGKILSLEDLKALQAEEEAWMAKKKNGPSHHPMFWLMLRVATDRRDGACHTAPPQPGN